MLQPNRRSVDKHALVRKEEDTKTNIKTQHNNSFDYQTQLHELPEDDRVTDTIACAVQSSNNVFDFF